VDSSPPEISFTKILVRLNYLLKKALLSSKELRYKKRLFEKAFPEPDFKYFSNSKALCFSVNAIYVTNSTGKREEV
jgi:hypothetical protein